MTFCRINPIESTADMSFCLSFHQPLLGPTGEHWLDDSSGLSCKDGMCQHAVDDPLLSCTPVPTRIALQCRDRWSVVVAFLPAVVVGLADCVL
jgi:hypothetical protein